MLKRLSQRKQKENLKFAPIDAESEKIIHRISKSTGVNAMSIIHEALQVFEKSLGRQVIIRKPNSKWDLTINKYKDYQSIFNFEPDNNQ